MSYGWGPIVGVTVILLLAGWYAVRRFRVGSDDMEGSLGTLVAPVVLSLYLMVAAVAAVIGWDNNDSARDLTTQEATAATDLYWTATALPGAPGVRLRQDVRDYMSAVVHDDWPQMRDGDLSEQGESTFDLLRHEVLAIPGAGERAVADRAQAVQQVNELARLRGERASSAGPSIPILLTLTTAFTGLAVIVIPLAAYVRGSRTNLMWNTLMSVMVVGSVVIVLLIDNAYQGPFAVSPAPLQDAAQGFATIDKTVAAG